MVKNILLWAVILVVLMSVFSNFGQRVSKTPELAYSSFLDRVRQGQVKSVTLEPGAITGVDYNESRFTVVPLPIEDPRLIDDLYEHNVEIIGKKPAERSLLFTIFINWFPILLFIGVWIFFMRQMQGGGGGRGAMSFGKSRAKLLGEDQVKVTFEDVAGVEEAKEEVSELVEFLRDPRKFQRIGGHIPRGVLMVGSPGTGKTLLARAIAGEAKVPFFSISGSDFVEMFVGVGASRVRDMFEQAKKQAPCIIFIDEIDAVGRHRGAGVGGGHDEREQTLNQLLVEMDGFEGGEGVIVIAATNRPDVLDPALLRPGRFDRQVIVGLPDVRGREQILKVHLKKVNLADDVKPSLIARGTPGFSGADLANLVNEAALLTARANKKQVDMAEMERAKDKIMMGAERRSMVMTEDEKLLTAYHEAGHAVVGLNVPEHDPVYKVTIIPRGRALGVTMYLPEQDRYSYSKQRLESQIASLFGGRLAESIIFGEDKVTTGAQNDIERATDIARKMVTKWGLSSRMGPLAYDQDEGEVFLGHSVAKRKEVAEETAAAIDQEVRAIIERNYALAERILTEHREVLEKMTQALMKYETIDADQIDDIVKGLEPREPKEYGASSNDKSSDGDADKDITESKDIGENGNSDSSKKDSSKGVGDPANSH